MRWLFAVAGVLTLSFVLARRAHASQNSPPLSDSSDSPISNSSWSMPSLAEIFNPSLSNSWSSSEPDQGTNLFEDIFVNLNPTTYTPASVSSDTAARNASAFLMMIRYAEGTAGPDGYRTLFGGALFDSYGDHPRIYVPFRDTSSSAAGAYQILARTWDGLRGKLNLYDFSPASQDLAALELIRERGALNDVYAGRVVQAISKVSKVWASLPGAGYNQPERQLSALVSAYADAGGNLEQA